MRSCTEPTRLVLDKDNLYWVSPNNLRICLSSHWVNEPVDCDQKFIPKEVISK